MQNIAIDVLTDEVTLFTAYDFFVDRGKIKDNLQLVFYYNLKNLSFRNLIRYSPKCAIPILFSYN